MLNSIQTLNVSCHFLPALATLAAQIYFRVHPLSTSPQYIPLSTSSQYIPLVYPFRHNRLQFNSPLLRLAQLRESRLPPNQIFRCFFIFFIYKLYVVKLFKNIFPKFQNSSFRTHCAVKPDAQLCCAPRPAHPLATVSIFRVKFL